MTTTRTFTCPVCGATLATSAAPGITIACEYCNSPFVVPAPSLDQPGDSQATVIANFSRRGNPSPMPPAGPDGTPPSTPDLPPDPDSPAGGGNTVDSDAAQPLVGRGPVDDASAESLPAYVASEAAPVIEPEPSPEPELRTPEIIEELDAPEAVSPSETAPEPEAAVEPEPAEPPVADPRAAEMTMIAPSRVRASLAEAEAAAEASAAEADAPASEPGSLPVTPGASVADLIAEPTKYGAAIPAEQGEPVVMGPGNVKVMPPQTPVAGGPPGAAMRSGGNRTPLIIGGVIVALCCLGSTCVALVAVANAVMNAGG